VCQTHGTHGNRSNNQPPPPRRRLQRNDPTCHRLTLPTTTDFAAGCKAARVAALLTWPPDGIPPFATHMPPTPGAWDGKPAAHRRGAAPRVQGWTSPDHNPPTAEHYTQVMAWIDVEYPPTADAYARVIERDDDSQFPQTARWSGGGPGHGRRHAPRAQWRHSPTAEYHAHTIALIHHRHPLHA
jgi:hypothetical protein